MENNRQTHNQRSYGVSPHLHHSGRVQQQNQHTQGTSEIQEKDFIHLINIQIDLKYALNKKEVIRLREDDLSVIEIFKENYKKFQAADTNRNSRSSYLTVIDMKEKFIKLLNDKKHDREMFVRDMNGKRHFEKKMGFHGDAPENYNELKQEILKWQRVGMKVDNDLYSPLKVAAGGMFSKQVQIYKTTGFVRYFDLSHTYRGIDQDIDRLINEGYLIEFKHKDVVKIQNKRTGIEPLSLLYPVNVDGEKDIEIRGSTSKYTQESLKILAELWGDDKSDQKRDQYFNWQEIIEKNTLLDEQEMQHYQYRKDKLNSFQIEENEVKTGGQGRRGVQKNTHLINWDFLTNIN